MKLKLLCFVITAFSVVTYAKIPTTIRPTQIATNSTSNRFIVNENTNPIAIQRVRLRFSAEDGLKRPLVLAFTPNNAATDGYDYGYDARNFDQYPNDMFWNIENENYIIQSVGAFDTSKAYPLNINISNPGLIKITLTDLENFDSDIDVFIYDALLDTYTQINTTDFEKTLDANTYMDRFFLAFTSDASLSVENPLAASVFVNYLDATDEIFIKIPEITNVEKVHLINLLGQSIKTWNKRELDTYNNGIRIPVDNVSDGHYIIKVETDSATFNKKILIKS